ncbi:hypothetical protein PGH45_04715 [Legionella pneumophila]|nr:hypothetical protein [Legionella pneumophila]
MGDGNIAIEPRWLNLAAWASVQSENIFDYDEVSGFLPIPMISIMPGLYVMVLEQNMQKLIQD